MVPQSSATDEINSSRAEGAGRAGSTHRDGGGNYFGSSFSIWGTNETQGNTCRGMPNTCLLVELIQPWPNRTVMQKCASIFVQFRGSVLRFRKSRIKTISGGFPGGAVVENPPANAGDTGSSPGLGGSHMPRSGWAREPQLLSLHVWSLCSTTREAAIVRGPCTAMKSGPRSPQLEKALAQKRRPNTAKNK